MQGKDEVGNCNNQQKRTCPYFPQSVIQVVGDHIAKFSAGSGAEEG